MGRIIQTVLLLVGLMSLFACAASQVQDRSPAANDDESFVSQNNPELMHSRGRLNK